MAIRVVGSPLLPEGELFGLLVLLFAIHSAFKKLF